MNVKHNKCSSLNLTNSKAVLTNRTDKTCGATVYFIDCFGVCPFTAFVSVYYELVMCLTYLFRYLLFCRLIIVYYNVSSIFSEIKKFVSYNLFTRTKNQLQNYVSKYPLNCLRKFGIRTSTSEFVVESGEQDSCL